MSAYLHTAWTVFLKDVRIEARTRESLVSILVFSVLVAFIFNFAFDPNPRVLATVGPGIVWVAFVFTGVIGLNRNFVLEQEQGTLDALLLAPVAREALYAGKLLGVFALMTAVEALMLPVFVVLYDLPVLNGPFVGVTLAATLGFAAVGTLFSAIAVRTRAREVLLPLLFLPAALPVLIGAVASSSDIFAGQGWSEYGRWLQLILIFDVVFIVVTSVAFEAVIEE